MLAACPLCMAAFRSRSFPLNSTVPGAQSFVNRQAGSKAVPALQPADVFDSDYPVDMASLTPQELRYKAQADYARAVAALRREAAEAEAARKIMEKELRELIAAKEAAANAKAAAEKAAKEAAALKARLAKESAEAGVASKDADGAAAALAKQEAELAAAKKAYDDALKAEDSMEAKLAAMKKKHEELCAQIKKVEAEQNAAKASAAGAGGKIADTKQGVLGAEQDVESAEAKAAREAAQAKQAAKEAEAAKARLAAAEAAATKAGQANMDAETARLKKEYEMAKEMYTKEANDVKAAQKRVDMAKAELAKWETHSAARVVAPLFAVALVVLSSL